MIGIDKNRANLEKRRLQWLDRVKEKKCKRSDNPTTSVTY